MNENNNTIDSNVNNKCNSSEHNIPVKIVWRNVIGMSVLHLVALNGLILGCTGVGHWKLYLNIWFLNFLGGFSILAGAHRLWSHRGYKAKWPLRLFLAFFQTAAMQNSIYEWCRDHRVHHKFSDTDADPHNSRRGFFFAHMGWLLCRKHPDVKEKGKSVDMTDLWSDPIVRFQSRFYLPLVVLIRGLVFTGLVGCVWMGQSVWHSLCANAFCYVVTLHHTWLVNSAAHIYGTRPYDKYINPRENIGVVYASMGEGYHNYHHTFPYDYSASELGWKDNFNPATAFIDVCAYVGLAYDLRMPSQQMVNTRIKRTGDSTLLHTKLNYWFDMFCGVLVIFWPLIAVYSVRVISHCIHLYSI